MKSLKEYIHEGLLDEGLLDRVKNKEVNHDALIKEFLKDNYKINGSYTIKGTKDGFVVDVKGYIKVINKDITSLTNGLFEFGEVSGEFLCSYCKNLTSLEGAPEKVGGTFECYNCKALTTLEGAPEKVGDDFSCRRCESLKSLEGAPKEVGDFSCVHCQSLTTLKGAPQKVGGEFDCSECESLKTLEGSPREVGGGFWCRDCGIQFTEEDVKKHTTAAKKIYI